jgi:hypothetical protein
MCFVFIDMAGAPKIFRTVFFQHLCAPQKSKTHKNKNESYRKLMSTLTKLSGSLRKAKAIEKAATTSQEKRKAQTIVSRLKRAVQKARTKHYKETFGY